MNKYILVVSTEKNDNGVDSLNEINIIDFIYFIGLYVSFYISIIDL